MITQSASDLSLIISRKNPSEDDVLYNDIPPFDPLLSKNETEVSLITTISYLYLDITICFEC